MERSQCVVACFLFHLPPPRQEGKPTREGWRSGGLFPGGATHMRAACTTSTRASDLRQLGVRARPHCNRPALATARMPFDPIAIAALLVTTNSKSAWKPHWSCMSACSSASMLQRLVPLLPWMLSPLCRMGMPKSALKDRVERKRAPQPYYVHTWPLQLHHPRSRQPACRKTEAHFFPGQLPLYLKRQSKS